MRNFSLAGAFLIVLGFCVPASADVGLADWCVNVNGSVDAGSFANNPSNACNGGTNAPLASVDITGWDHSLESVNTNNTLGSIVVTLGAGNNQNVAVYMDYDVDFSTQGSFQDYGTVNGAAGAEVSYELDDPNTSSIFSDFAGAPPLPDSNNVGTFQGPNANGVPDCCDVAWALSLSGINLAAGFTDTITFTVSTTAPTGGFYLQQTNGILNANGGFDSIYLSVAEDIVPPSTGGGTTPEPSAWLLLATLIGVVGIGRKMSKRRAVL